MNNNNEQIIANSTVSEILQQDRSLYSTQFALGFRSLTFIDQMEEGFRGFYLDNNPGQLKRVIPVAFVLTLLFFFSDYLRLPPEAFAQFYIYRAIQIAVLALLTVMIFRGSTRYLEYTVMLALVIYGISTPVLLGIIRATDGYAPISAQLIVLVFCYFLAGLRFFQAMFVGLVISLAYPASQLLYTAPLPNLPFNCFLILTFNVMGLCGAYFIEYTARENYLGRQLLGELALFDGLTGLLNRRAFSLDLENLYRQAKRDKVELGIAMVDVDHFKQFNDYFGHVRGDQCLREIADALRNSVKRPLDKAGRYGGEEFILVWYNCSAQSAKQLGDVARAAVEEMAIPHGPDASQPLMTVSVGVATASAGDLTDSGQLVWAADQALYKAKSSGRNRVVLASPLPQQ